MHAGNVENGNAFQGNTAKVQSNTITLLREHRKRRTDTIRFITSFVLQFDTEIVYKMITLNSVFPQCLNQNMLLCLSETNL